MALVPVTLMSQWYVGLGYLVAFGLGTIIAMTAYALVAAAAYHDGPVYIRTSRPKTPVIYANATVFRVGGSTVLRESARPCEADSSSSARS